MVPDMKMVVSAYKKIDKFINEDYITDDYLLFLVEKGEFHISNGKDDAIIGKNNAMIIMPNVRYHRKILKPASDILPDVKDVYETVVLQGTVDLFFKNERGNLTVVDYKTDSISDEDDIIRKYKAQILLYKLAIEEITGKKCDECIIYHLGEDKIINI